MLSPTALSVMQYAAGLNLTECSESFAGSGMNLWGAGDKLGTDKSRECFIYDSRYEAVPVSSVVLPIIITLDIGATMQVEVDC